MSGVIPLVAADGTKSTLSLSAPVVTVGARNPVMLVMMETYGFSELQGNSSAPFINSLFTNYAVVPYTSLGHNSAPNYVCITSGIDVHTPTSPDYNASIVGDSTVNLDATGTRTTIFDQCHAAGLAWAVYNDPNAATYRNPYNFFPHLSSLQPVVSVSEGPAIAAQLNSGNPVFVMVIPNNTDNMHSSSIAAGDSYLNTLVTNVQGTNWYKNGGQIVIAWDEQDSFDGDSTSATTGGTVAAIVVSNAVKGKGVVNTPCATAGVLGSIEDSLGLARLGTAIPPGPSYSPTPPGGLGTLLGGTAPPPPPPPPPSPQPTGPTGTWTLVFDDEFNGTSLDTTKWNSSWFNGGNMNNVNTSAANVAVANGNVGLTLSSSTLGALISTDPTQGAKPGFQYTVGVVEARIWFPGNGTLLYNWPAFWTTGQNWPTTGENDVAEVLSGFLTVNYHDSAGANNGPNVPGYFGGGFHVFTINRMANSSDVYYDGTLVRSYPTADASAPQYIVINVGSGEGPAAYGATSQLLVDYVRAWTPG